jgi:hypothetical protein
MMDPATTNNNNTRRAAANESVSSSSSLQGANCQQHQLQLKFF